MKRSKRHKVKQETSETSTSRVVNQTDHDLAYYIHDRVELMHQVFTVLKPKEVQAMAPECVRHVNINDLQELCMEELLGISSKRLCAILDGADPPSDTESSSESSPDMLETISLDSISSDDEILSQVSSKKSKKHKHHSKSKSKKKKSKNPENKDREQEDKSRRAGLTMLELLELQARARAIRAQLQNEQALAVSTSQPSETVTANSSDDEVEIKEETAEVVEISSEDEKPNVKDLEGSIAASQKQTECESNNGSNSTKTVTKKVNDLIITVPQTNTSRRIKLKRNPNPGTKDIEKTAEKDKNTAANTCAAAVVENNKSGSKNYVTENSSQSAAKIAAVNLKNTDSCTSKTVEIAIINLTKDAKNKGKSKIIKKKKRKDKQKDKDGSDHDEITLQLSDTEKMDLLEDLEEKKFEMSSDTVDSSEDSDSEDERARKSNKKQIVKNKDISRIEIAAANDTESKEEIPGPIDEVQSSENDLKSDLEKSDSNNVFENDTGASNKTNDEQGSSSLEIAMDENSSIVASGRNNTNTIKVDNAIEISNINDIPIQACDDEPQDINLNTQVLENIQEHEGIKSQEIKSNDIDREEQSNEENSTKIDEVNVTDSIQTEDGHSQMNEEISIIQSHSDSEPNSNKNITNKDDLENNADKDNEVQVKEGNKQNLNDKSEGELSDRESSEVEESELKSEIVCISDDDETKRKKKKKGKKSKRGKKEKKCKKSKDFRESADHNFYSELANETKVGEVILIPETTAEHTSQQTITDIPTTSDALSNTDVDHDVYEILELSDDSSCYEVEEISISKEPTAEEIQALSAKIDEIERDKAMYIHEMEGDKTDRREPDSEDVEHVSWKDRYLKSTKVKRVLSTANILNAMRRKNLELKKKLLESKAESKITEECIEAETDCNNPVEGTIEHYNTLEGSTKYVDPVKDKENTANMTSGINKESNDTLGGATAAANKENVTDKKDKVTKEMKNEAKQLLKMYKMLLKYNDVYKQKDKSKKKKKNKKCKDKDKSVASLTR